MIEELPTDSAATSFSVRLTRHRKDRFWVQVVRSHTGRKNEPFCAVQDPEYFFGWRDFCASFEDMAIPGELRKTFAHIYDAGLWESLDD